MREKRGGKMPDEVLLYLKLPILLVIEFPFTYNDDILETYIYYLHIFTSLIVSGPECFSASVYVIREKQMCSPI